MTEPLNMVLHCPTCGFQHVDAKEWVDDPHDIEHGQICTWPNPPHKSHLCKACGTVWRPADVPTNGVQAVATRGKDDTWPTGAWPAPPRPKGEAAFRYMHMNSGVPVDPDAKAKEIYNSWQAHPEWVPWVEGGNSNKQNEARRLAAKL